MNGLKLSKFQLNIVALTILIFIPKYSLIAINGYFQGIRIEDLLILIITIGLIFQRNIIIWPKKFILVYIYLLIVMIVMSIMGVEQEWIILVRGVEYFVIAQICIYSLVDKLIISKILISYIIINTIVGVLQHSGYIGGMTSFAYLPAGHGWLERAYGITGGPWEVGLTLILALHILIRLQISKIILVILSVMVLFDLILADTRANIIAYIIYLSYSFRTKNKLILILLIISILFIPYFTKINLRYESLLNILSQLAQLNLNYMELLNIDLSLSQRFNIWIDNYEIWSQNIAYIMFGIGWHSLYMESFILRLIFTFGLFGSLFICFLFKGIDKSILLLTLVSGLTLDMFLSMKIFTFYLIYARLAKNNFLLKNNEKYNYLCSKC